MYDALLIETCLETTGRWDCFMSQQSCEHVTCGQNLSDLASFEASSVMMQLHISQYSLHPNRLDPNTACILILITF